MIYAASGVRPRSGQSRRDESLTRKVWQSLQKTGYVRQVDVDVHEGNVTLRGNVSSYYHKQMAQETAKRVAGVESLRNDIIVR